MNRTYVNRHCAKAGSQNTHNDPVRKEGTLSLHGQTDWSLQRSPSHQRHIRSPWLHSRHHCT